ncbi:MAG: GNAT family N-acetyltransferase [Phycisphaerales bacterium]
MQPPIPYMDHATCHRLETIMSTQNAGFARRGKEMDPAGSFATTPVLGGHAVFASPEASPVNKVTGGGLSGPVAPDEFDRFEAFFRERGVPPKLEVGPFADASLLKLLRERGYTVETFMCTHVRYMGAAWEEPAPSPSVAVEPATPGTIEEFSDTIVRGFLEGAPMVAAFRDMNRGMADLPGALPLIARLDGCAAGAASMRVSTDDAGPVGVLFGASTLPEFRRRGVQTALLAARLRHAREKGCGVAVVQSRPGTSSERNMARFGFRLAYNKAVMSKA